MASSTEICNIALSHLNIGKEIANVLTEQSQEASACRRFYDLARTSTLRDFNWPFASRFVTLSLVQQNPTTEWGFSYRYPTDCARLRRFITGFRNETRQQRVPYKIASDNSGLLVLCNIEDAKVEYTRDESDPQKFASDFILALSYRIAYYIAPRLTAGDPFQLQEKCLKLYSFELSKAQANSVNEEQIEEMPESEFIRARD